MYVWWVSLGEELPGCVYYQALVLVGMVVGWVVYCHARLDRGVGSPVYMVNQTTRHQMRLKIRSWDHPGKEDKEDEDPAKKTRRMKILEKKARRMKI